MHDLVHVCNYVFRLDLSHMLGKVDIHPCPTPTCEPKHNQRKTLQAVAVTVASYRVKCELVYTVNLLLICSNKQKININDTRTW